MYPFWDTVANDSLAQGDCLLACITPQFGPFFDSDGGVQEVPISEEDLIVVTQSCDLANKSVGFVALCPIQAVEAFEAVNPDYKTRGRWEAVRKGRVPGLHLLPSPWKPEDNRQAFVVDFGHIISLPHTYLQRHAGDTPGRHRLRSPYLEHFSQAFARFFMRVGLPSDIPPFK